MREARCILQVANEPFQGGMYKPLAGGYEHVEGVELRTQAPEGLADETPEAIASDRVAVPTRGADAEAGLSRVVGQDPHEALPAGINAAVDENLFEFRIPAKAGRGGIVRARHGQGASYARFVLNSAAGSACPRR